MTEQPKRPTFTPKKGATPAARGGKKTFTAPAGKPAGKRPPFRKKPELTEQQKQQQAARKARLERIEKTQKVLQKHFPAVFTKGDVKPLPVDVHVQLFEHFADAQGDLTSPVRRAELRKFLASHIRCEDYQRAVFKYKYRFNLDGSKNVDFTASELDYHKQQLDAKVKRKPARKPGFKKPAGKPGAKSFKPGEKPAFKAGAKPAFKTKPATTTQTKVVNRTRRGPDVSKFVAGAQVQLGDKVGTVVDVVGDKVKVKFANGLTFSYAADKLTLKR